MTVFAILFLVGNFLFGHFQQNLTPSIGITHAQDLHTDLMPKLSSQTWIFTIWKVALALANVIVIVMLLFVAVVNIVHLQYDTYAIKKSLPLLIIGIVMSNFSLLICRMIVDAAQVIANTFASNPKELATGLLCSIGVVTGGSSTAPLKIMGPSVLATGLIIMIFVFLLILIAVFILAFLLWFRKTVIFLLVAVAPVAFILYAFPPTQGLFKTWWSWFLKWTFMGPIVMLLVWVASVIGKTNCDAVTNVSGTTFSISALFATCGVLYLAAIVPFKLGGPLMGAIGKAGQWATGTNKGGYLRKPVDESIQRKKDAAKGAVTTAWGNTRMGQWSDRGKKNEEGLIANYKNIRDTQLTDREDENRTRRHHDFAENEKALERAKGRLDTTIKSQIAIYLQDHAYGVGDEKLRSINAAGDVEHAESDAETLARGPAESSQATIQRLRETEVTRAKNELELSKGNTDALIKEGTINNLTPAEMNDAFGVGAPAMTPMDIKGLYLEQENNLVMLKERLAKRAGQDTQVMAERDLRNNTDVRAFVQELQESDVGIDANYTLDGTAAAPGSVRVNYAQAREAAEQLRYRATTERDPADRARFEAAAQHFETQARTFEGTHGTYNAGMETALRAQEGTLRTAAGAATTPAETARLTHQADQMRERANFVHTNLGQQVGLRERYLTNNLAGRRMKVINPDIADEIHTQEISCSPQQLVTDVINRNPDGTIRRDGAGLAVGSCGTGEARANFGDIRNIVRGNIDAVDESAARAGVVQLGAIHSTMKTARHGDAAGLESINGFNEIMHESGRDNFKVVAARNALNAMNPKLRDNMMKETMRQAGTLDTSSGADSVDVQWAGLTAAQQEASLQGLNFNQLDLKSQVNTGQRDFVDRYLTQVEEDPAMRLATSPGARLGRSRPVGEHEWTENR